MFTLDHRLENDSEFIADWGVFSLRQMKDERFFWLLIIPRLPAISEWHDLSAADLAELNKLISYLSYHIKQIEKANKINVGALGNMVSQFHLHLIARHHGDAAWPGPVWGAGTTVPPAPAKQKARRQIVLDLLADFRTSP